MQAFKDNKDRIWSISINVGALARVKALASCDLLAVLDDSAALLGHIYDDYLLLGEIGWALCKPEAESKSITVDQFAEGLFGQGLTRLSDAILEELSDFFPDPRKGAMLRLTIKKLKEIEESVLSQEVGKATAALNGLDIASTAQSVIDSFGNSPAKPESTPATSP